MAKDKKNENKVNVNTVTEENIVEQIKNANKFSDEIVKAAAEKAEEKDRQRKIEELNEIKDKAAYINLASVLRTRLARQREKAISECRVKSKELLEDVLAGKLTGVEYDKAIDEAVDEANKRVDAANKEYEMHRAELRNQFPASYRYEWDNPFRRIKSVKEN